MIKQISIVFRNAINKTKIFELTGLSVEEASLIVKAEGYIRVGSDDYAIVQMVNNIFPNGRDGTLEIVATMFVRKVRNDDYYLMR
jgi:hypothetical protein